MMSSRCKMSCSSLLHYMAQFMANDNSKTYDINELTDDHSIFVIPVIIIIIRK